MNKNLSLLRAGASVATGAAMVGSGLLLALPAFADTTGYDTGYTYTQGLAIGAGGQLMQGAGAQDATAVSQSQAATPVAAADGTALTQSTQPVAVAETAPAAAPAVQSAAVASGFTLADIAMPAAWIALLALLILVSLAAWAFSGTRRREHYHQPAFR